MAELLISWVAGEIYDSRQSIEQIVECDYAGRLIAIAQKRVRQ